MMDCTLQPDTVSFMVLVTGMIVKPGMCPCVVKLLPILYNIIYIYSIYIYDHSIHTHYASAVDYPLLVCIVSFGHGLIRSAYVYTYFNLECSESVKLAVMKLKYKTSIASLHKG